MISEKYFFLSTYSRKSEERNSEHTETRCHNFPHPSPRYCIAVTDCCNCYDSPPQGISVAGKTASVLSILVNGIFFSQIDKITAEN